MPKIKRPGNADDLADRLDAALPPGQSNLPNNDNDDVLIHTASLLASSPRPEIPLDMLARIQTRVLDAYHQQPHNNRPEPVRKVYRPAWHRAAAIAAAVTIIGAAALLWRGAQPSISQQVTLTPAGVAAQPTAVETDAPEPSAIPTLTAVPPSPTNQPATLPSATTAPPPTLTATLPPTYTETPFPSPTPFTAYISANQVVNVRAEPSRQATVIAMANPGEAVTILNASADGDWKYVSLSSGRAGWIASPLLSPNKPLIASITPGETTVPGQPGQPDDPSAAPDAEDGSEDQNGGDFGCEHPGNYCNAPGQDDKQPPGQDKKDDKTGKDKPDKP